MPAHEYLEPRPHVVVDGFLSPDELREARAELLRLKPRLRIGLQGQAGRSVLTGSKRNRLVVLGDSMRVGGRPSRILESFRKRLWSPYVLERLELAYEPLFQLLRFCRGALVQVSAYGDGDFYDFHVDANPVPGITAVLFLCRPPRAFTGGDFILEFRGRRKRVAFKDNRLVIFPSGTRHRVTPVRCRGSRFEDMRFSVQCWPHLTGRAAELPERPSTAGSAAHGKMVPTFAAPEGAERAALGWLALAAPGAGSPSAGEPASLMRDFSDLLQIWSSNLQYLARELDPGSTLALRLEPPRDGRFRLSGLWRRAAGGGARFGYEFAAARGALEARLFAGGEDGRGEAAAPLSLRAGYAATRRLLERLLASSAGLSKPART